MTALTRRAVLASAGAAMVVAGVPAAMLAGASDARIVALAEEHDRTLTEMDKAGDRWYEAVTERMPPHLRHVALFDRTVRVRSTEAFHAALKACDYPEVKALKVVEDRLRERCRELAGWLSQTHATTFQGVCTKFRIAMGPRHGTGCNLIDSAVADLERLAEEAQS